MSSLIQVGIGLNTPRCAHGGHTARQIKSRRGEHHLWEKLRFFEFPIRSQIRSGFVVEMIVHADDSRHNRVSGQIEYRYVRSGGHIRFAIATIFPPTITMFWSSIAGAPVPSIIRTWVSTIFGASTVTNCLTVLDSSGVCPKRLRKGRRIAKSSVNTRRPIITSEDATL